MTDLQSRLATGLGLALFFGGIGLLALGVPTRRGVGYELVFGQGAGVPWWAYLLSFTAGPLLALVGAVVGMRYGNFERYHEDYDPQTGTIDSDHPFARLQQRVSKSDDPGADGDHPEKFVFSRAHLAALVGVLMGVPTVYLYLLPDFSPMLRWTVVAVLGGGAVGTFVVVDRVLRAEDVDYDASW